MTPLKASLDASRVDGVLESLSQANQRFAAVYPGESGSRQPVHSVYGGAQLFNADSTPRLGKRALQILEEYAPNALTFARAMGFPGHELLPGGGPVEAALLDQLKTDPHRVHHTSPPAWRAHIIYERIKEKLTREPVEDFRIDFEDGYGNRPDAEEDGHAASTAREVATGLKQGTLPPFIGIRIKPFSEEAKKRSVRTLDIFISELVQATGGKLPPNFVVTIPKVTVAEQTAALADLLDLLEQGLGLPANALKFELMVETPQSIIGPDGRCPLMGMVQAGRGRCVAAHFGTYDYTASSQITAAYQTMDHPACTHALNTMRAALVGTGLFLSDGATNIMPVPVHRAEAGQTLHAEQVADNMRSVYSAWRMHFGHVQNSLRNGYYQGWDLHPGQLVSRYAAVYAFFLDSLDSAADRLKNFVQRAAQATLLGDVFDDAATGQALLNYFLRAINCGAITEAETVERTGLTIDELNSRSFLSILNGRKA